MIRNDIVASLAQQIWRHMRLAGNAEAGLDEHDTRVWRQAKNDEQAECMSLAEACLEREPTETERLRVTDDARRILGMLPAEQARRLLG